MKAFFEQIAGLFGAIIAAACCLGVPVILSSLGALGLGFIVHDAYLLPLFVGFVGLSLWLLYRSARRNGDRRPFWLGLAGGLTGSVALWFMVTGIYPLPWLVYLSLAVLISGSLWDFVNGRRRKTCPTEVCETPAAGSGPANPARRVATGAALSAGAAVAFYGLYKSVAIFTPEKGENTIACWGINECKGTTACTTAFNACTGQNECRGRGYLYVPPKECYARGGVPLEQSEGNPARG